MIILKRGSLIFMALSVLAIGCGEDDDDDDATVSPAATKLAFTNVALTQNELGCGELELQLQDADGNEAVATKKETITLSASAGSFYSDEDCQTAITSATFEEEEDSKILYFRSKANGESTLTATDSAAVLTAITQTATTTVSMLGTWLNSCRVDPNDNTKYLQDSFVFSAPSAVVWTQKRYGDSACTAAQIEDTSVLTGTFALGQGNPLVSDGHNIDYTWTKLEVTVASGALSAFNTNSRYGKTDWVADTATDVTGLTDGSNKVTAGDIHKDVKMNV